MQELVLRKDKQNRQSLEQAHQEKKREDPNKHNQKWKRTDYNWYHQNTKDCQKLLPRTICQEIENLNEVDKFLEKYNLSKVNEETESLNRLVRADEIEAVTKKLPAHKNSGLDGFTGEFYQTFKDEWPPNLLKLLQKIQEKGRLPNSFNSNPTAGVIP